MKLFLKYVSVLVLTLVLLNTRASAQARQWALNVTGNDIYLAKTGPIVIGWGFEPLADIQVRSLGICVPIGAGEAGIPHDVAIWDITHPGSNIVAAIKVEDDDPVNAMFRYHDLDTPVTLNAGVEYVLGALYPEGFTFHGLAEPGVIPAPGIKFIDFRSSLVFDGNVTVPQRTGDRAMGPNFQFTPVVSSVAAAPEPTSATLILGTTFLTGAALLAGCRRQRHAA